MADRYEYKVIELREGLMGGKMSGEKLQKVLNEQASQGWQLKATTGQIGPGGVEGVLVTSSAVGQNTTSSTRAQATIVQAHRGAGPLHARGYPETRHRTPVWVAGCADPDTNRGGHSIDFQTGF